MMVYQYVPLSTYLGYSFLYKISYKKAFALGKTIMNKVEKGKIKSLQQDDLINYYMPSVDDTF